MRTRLRKFYPQALFKGDWRVECRRPKTRIISLISSEHLLGLFAMILFIGLRFFKGLEFRD